jgi:glycosyltransferase involved in cell wall biosynthesis
MKEECISICIASYNTLSTRKEGLEACLKGLKKSIRFFNNLHQDVRVVVCWVDDASTDNTLEYVKYFLNKNKISYQYQRLKVNSHQGYCRNLATKLVASDYIMFCDSDDVYLEEHIKVCYDMINTQDSAGRKFGIASTLAYLSPELRIHPDWIPRISSTIPITKIVRREVWDFIEGFPNSDIYKKTGCEDEDFMKLANYFFGFLITKEAQTVEYCNYPGSFFDRQLPKFRKHPNLAEPDDDDKAKMELHRIRSLNIDHKLEYLKEKLVFTEWYNKLESLVTLYV